jgi:hypothetical protein
MLHLLPKIYHHIGPTCVIRHRHSKHRQRHGDEKGIHVSGMPSLAPKHRDSTLSTTFAMDHAASHTELQR